MEDNKVSLTALLTAYARAYHATHDDPKIFDDYLANSLFTEQERAYFGQNLAKSLEFIDPERAATCPDWESALAAYMQLQGGPVTLSRSRYTEDSLATAVQQGVQQYVILGAGLDTFAFRRPEWMMRLNVFEVDQPATQAFKRNRLAELGWELPAQLHFVPVDFSTESLISALRRSAYDPRTTAFFSWLGVTYYLSQEVVLDTLRAVADVAPVGSTLLFDYIDPDAFVPERAATRMQRMQAIVQHIGEPMQANFDPGTLAVTLESTGWRLTENLSPVEIENRYFQGREDDYHAFKHFHFARAVIAKAS